MKIKFSTLLFLFALTGAVSQVPATLQSEVKKLYIACHDIDLTALTEMLCVEDADTYEKLDAYFLNDEQKFRYVQTDAKYNYGEIKTIDGKSYCPITFRNVVRVTYFKPIDVPAKQAELKVKYKAQSVNYNQARNAFMIIYTAKMAAVSQDGKWTFAFADETLPLLSGSCLTEEIKTQLGL